MFILSRDEIRSETERETDRQTDRQTETESRVVSMLSLNMLGSWWETTCSHLSVAESMSLFLCMLGGNYEFHWLV